MSRNYISEPHKSPQMIQTYVCLGKKCNSFGCEVFSFTMKNLFLIALTQLAFTTGQEGYGKSEILGYHNSNLLQCDTI